MCRSSRSAAFHSSPVGHLVGSGRRTWRDSNAVALAWLPCAPNVLLIPGTSSVVHLKENHAAANLRLPPQVVERLNSIAVISR